jgi:hypothetical protein
MHDLQTCYGLVHWCHWTERHSLYSTYWIAGYMRHKVCLDVKQKTNTVLYRTAICSFIPIYAFKPFLLAFIWSLGNILPTSYYFLKIVTKLNKICYYKWLLWSSANHLTKSTYPRWVGDIIFCASEWEQVHSIVNRSLNYISLEINVILHAHSNVFKYGELKIKAIHIFTDNKSELCMKVDVNFTWEAWVILKV